MLVVPRLACPSWRWMMLSGKPSRASANAWAWRSWWGANLRLIPAAAASRRNSWRTAASDHGRPRGRSVDDAEQRRDRQLDPCGEPWAQLLPAPLVDADL